jgi:hypothetical protein
MSTEQQEYELKGVSFTEVTEEIQKIWEQMQQPGSQVTKLVDEKLIASDEFDQLKNRSVEEVIVLDKGAGFAGEVALIVAFAPVAAKITKDVWEHFILPRLIRRFGSDAITPKKGRN